MVAKPVRGSTAKHKGKAAPIFAFGEDGKCEVTLTLDLKVGGGGWGGWSWWVGVGW